MKKVQFVIIMVGLLVLLISPLAISAQDGFTTFSTEDGLVTFSYPAEWFVEADEQGNINIGNSEAVLAAIQAGNFVPAEGDVLISLLFVPTDYAAVLGLSGETLEEKVTGLAASLVFINQDKGPDRTVVVDEVVLLEAPADSDEAAIAQVAYTQGTTTEGVLAVWQTPQDFIGVAVLLTSPGNTAAQEENLHVILRSLEFSQTFAEILAEYSNR